MDGRGPGDGSGATSDWESAGRGRAARRRAAGAPARADAPRADAPRADAPRADAPRADAPRADAPRAAAARTSTRGRRSPGARTATTTKAGAGADGEVTRSRTPRRLGGLRVRRSARSAPASTPPRPVPPHIRRRRRSAAVAAVLALLVGVGVGTWALLYVSGLATVQDVTVTGLSTVPEQAVRDAAAVPSGGPLVAVDTAGIAARVAAVEGVAAVKVRRAWPHTVEVAVTERVPVALWQNPQGLFEVDGTGLAFRPAPTPPPALPRLAFTGVTPQDPSTAAALVVLHDLTDPLRAQVATVDVAGTKVTLGLGDGRSVRWGDPDRSPDKIAVLTALLGQPGSVYDVSSPDLPTVRP